MCLRCNNYREKDRTYAGGAWMKRKIGLLFKRDNGALRYCEVIGDN